MRLQAKTIAITRPTGQATKLVALLSDAGASVVDFALIAIAPLDDYEKADAQFKQLDQVDRLIFISSNAVHNAMPRIQALWPKGLPAQLKFAAIGPVTAQTLAEYGIQSVLIPQDRFDSESLLAMPEMQVVSAQNIMIVRGIGGRELLAQTLSQRGATVNFAECYQRINPQTNCDAIYDAQTQQPLCEAIIVTSSEAMRHLIEMAGITGQNSAQHWLKKVKVCVNLPRVAEPAINLGLSTYIAGKPGDEAMLNCLSNAFS